MHTARLVLQRLTVSSLILLGIAACSAEPQPHPLNTGQIPADARVLDNCSPTGELACSGWSVFQGDKAAERRSACTAYIEATGRRVEMCGSISASQP